MKPESARLSLPLSLLSRLVQGCISCSDAEEATDQIHLNKKRAQSRQSAACAGGCFRHSTTYEMRVDLDTFATSVRRSDPTHNHPLQPPASGRCGVESPGTCARRG